MTSQNNINHNSFTYKWQFILFLGFKIIIALDKTLFFFFFFFFFSTSKSMDIFFLFLHKNICYGYSLQRCV